MVDTRDAANLGAVFKAYDVRGLVPEQLDEALAQAIGRAYVQVLDTHTVVIGHDMRESSPALAAAFAEGATQAGADVVMIGLASTDQLYFASGRLRYPGAMITASHNPAQYNGIKLCRANAVPIGVDSGLTEIREVVASGVVPDVARTGVLSTEDLLDAYAAHLVGLAPVVGRKLKVVVDAGNGMAGHTVPAVFGWLGAKQVDLVPMYFDLDGSFPNHEANPIDPANLVELQERVVAEGADIGLAFDGDADRCFLVDERGRAVSPSTVTALIASLLLAKEPGATVIHNLITSRAVPELVAELGGVPVRTRVGHSYIKATMAETDAVFGGEHSGHYYFRNFWRADSGMLAALHVLGALAESRVPLSELLAGYERYVASGEINSTVSDPAGVIDALETTYGRRSTVITDRLDGLTVTHADWWFNVRPSNTEPLLRLNAEGRDEATMAETRDAVLTIIGSHEMSVRAASTTPAPGKRVRIMEEAPVTKKDAGEETPPPKKKAAAAAPAKAAPPKKRTTTAAAPSTPTPGAEPGDTGEASLLVDPGLLDIIVCPDCLGDLAVSGAELVCTGCGFAYPVRDGIPVLLVDEARKPG